MTVKSNVERKGPKSGGFHGLVRFKSWKAEQILQRKNQIGILSKARAVAKMKMRDAEWAWKLRKKWLDQQIAEKKEEIKELVKEANQAKLVFPKVKVKIEVIAPKRLRRLGAVNRTWTAAETNPEFLGKLGIPDQLAEAVKKVQEDVDQARSMQKLVIGQVDKIVKMAEEL